MIQHFTEDGRRVVTTKEAAALRGITEASMRKDILRRKKAGKVTDLPKIDDRTPVYYPEDLDIKEFVMQKTWTLSTDLSRDSLLSVLADLDLGGLEPGSPSGFHSGASLSVVGETDRPPAELQKVRAALIGRGDKASY